MARSTSARQDVLERAEVDVGLRSVERIEILSGLKPGDRIVISPVADMKPGNAAAHDLRSIP